MEIFIARADRLDPARVAGWLHVVVKREAQAICRSRKKFVGASDVDVDSHEALRLPSTEDRILSADLISRSAEALQRLKPQELRALWLKAEGHSYNEIAALTGWSYANVLELPPDVVAQQLGHRDGGKLVAQLYGHLEGRVARRRIRDAFAATRQAEPLRIVR